MADPRRLAELYRQQAALLVEIAAELDGGAAPPARVANDTNKQPRRQVRRGPRVPQVEASPLDRQRADDVARKRGLSRNGG